MNAEPPDMTHAAWREMRQDVDLHEHAIAVFTNEDDLLAHLARFIKTGRDAGQLMVFIHGFPQGDQAWEFVSRAYPALDELRKGQIVIVSLYLDAFEGDRGRIDHEHVASVVGSLTELAARRGHTGVRIMVDASRRYFQQGRLDEWFAFEAWLGRRLQANVGLVCAYHADDVARAEIFEKALHTHAYRFGNVS